MVPKISTFVLVACAVALTCGQNNISEDPQPHTTVSTTAGPTTNTTTSPSTTTTSPTTTSPTTTTLPTTTKSSTTSSPTTTEPPPTTTLKPTPTTTPSPTPKPPQKPDVGKWNVTDHESNVTCILVDMAIQLNISYIGNNKDNKTKHSVLLNVPKDADATGSCGNTSQTLDLEWKENNKSFGYLSLVFMKNDSTNHFMISSINLTIVPDNAIFPDIKNKSDIVLITNKTEFSTPVSKSYLCEKIQTIVLKNADGTNETDSEISVSHVHLEAFHTKKDASFGAAEDCEPSSSPDIVPIAVGCALVGLVAIVLIAYLVGRRRSQARGYLSM